jgi:hypothetical protein
MEETGGFEPPALWFCKPFHWTALARLLNGYSFVKTSPYYAHQNLKVNKDLGEFEKI